MSKRDDIDGYSIENERFIFYSDDKEWNYEFEYKKLYNLRIKKTHIDLDLIVNDYEFSFISKTEEEITEIYEEIKKRYLRMGSCWNFI